MTPKKVEFKKLKSEVVIFEIKRDFSKVGSSHGEAVSMSSYTRIPTE